MGCLTQPLEMEMATEYSKNLGITHLALPHFSLAYPLGSAWVVATLGGPRRQIANGIPTEFGLDCRHFHGIFSCAYLQTIGTFDCCPG